ncbi:MAG: PDZ domain-containing protein [Verrucomicrobiota bacterium]
MKIPSQILLACLLAGSLAAQQQPEDIPLLRPEERQAVDAQADEFNQALAPVLTTAAKSTVRVWAGKRRLAYGTVVADGRKILTKFSEVARAAGVLRVEAGAGDVRAATLTGVYQDEDLALLSIQGEPLTPVKWFAEKPGLGAFLTATQPGGQPAAFGVVSVLERDLRETDKAYLGVQGDLRFAGPGVKVQEVTAGSGAAEAGLRVGDVIKRVNQRPISGVLELRNALTGLAPGARLAMSVERGGKPLALEVLLGNRPDLPQSSGERLLYMEQMGGPTSRVHDSFSKVIQTDMRPDPNQIGGPVVDLHGRVVGITMARADRTRSFVMPSAAVTSLLDRKPLEPAQVRAAAPVARGLAAGERPEQTAPQLPGLVPANPERLRRHVDDMQRLLERMREEMQQLDGQDR